MPSSIRKGSVCDEFPECAAMLERGSRSVRRDLEIDIYRSKRDH